jgi:N-acylglucosamine-6-phosphate 2-epimerase/N-acetylmuramic acid 6-phosphate etherase
VVSCQARDDNPLAGPQFMRAMAQAAVQGGAAGIRAEGVADIAAIREALDVPIIGLAKRWDARFAVYITPAFADAAAIAAAGCDIVALDATRGSRDGEPVAELIPRLRRELGVAVMADIATLEEGLAAAAMGADYVGTTLAGYTPARAATEGPDLDLLAELAACCPVPVVAEGRFETASQVARAFALGAHAVVVGTAITNPREITRRLAAAAPGR